jgi:hypothetical protein
MKRHFPFVFGLACACFLIGASFVRSQPAVIPTVGPRSIMVNSNGVLVGASTNLFEANSNALNRVVLHPGEGGGSLPTGGTNRQVLAKLSSTDGDADWTNAFPDGGTQGQVLAKQSATNGDVGWTNPAAGGSSVLVEEAVIVNPNFKSGTNVLLEVQDVTNVVINVTSDVVNITTGDIGYLARTAAVVTVDESDGEVNAYTFTIAAGTLAVDGDELELYAMGRFRPYSGTANGYYYSLYSTELVTDILTDNIFEDEYSTVSSYPCEWRIRLKRVDANTLAASMLHTVSPPATLTPGSEATIVRTTGNPVIDLGLLSFADDDLEFVLQAEISDAMVSADLTFYGYTITKIGTGGSGGGDVSSVFGRTGAILAVSTDYDDYFQATNAALTALAANPQLYQATNAALTALAANPQLYQATNAALTALAANPQIYQATNAALTALAANPQLYQATNAALTALAANPQLYQATNANLTALASNPQIYQSTNAALTALSANPQLYQATNVALTALASNPQLYQSTNINLTALAADPQIYQATNATLTSLGALGNGIVAKTGAGALSARTVTGDSEIVVSNGDGVSGNPTLSIAAGITRDVEAAAAYAAISHAHAASDITSGTIATARLGSGTADSTTFLRGDGSWQTPAGGGGGGTKTIAVLTPSGNQPPAADYATFFTRNSIAVLEFDDTTDESAVWVSVIPEAATLTSGIKVRINWAGKTATSGDVRWVAQIERSNTDLDADSFDTATGATGTANGTSGIVTNTEITITDIDSVAAGELFRVKVYRDANDGADTMTGDAQLVAVELRTAN